MKIWYRQKFVLIHQLLRKYTSIAFTKSLATNYSWCLLNKPLHIGTWLVSQRSWVRYPVWPPTFDSPSADSRGTVVSYWRKYVHEVLVNRLGGLSLPRKSVVRLTDRPDMISNVYRGRRTTLQQQQQQLIHVRMMGQTYLNINVDSDQTHRN